MMRRFFRLFRRASAPARTTTTRRPLSVEALETRLAPAVFVVTNLKDSGNGSLRQAILDANAQPVGTDTIQFNLKGTGVQTIAPLSALPAVSGPVVIDGYSQPGAAAATATTPAVLVIEL